MTDTAKHDLEIAVVALEHFKDVQYREFSEPTIQAVIDRFRDRISAAEIRKDWQCPRCGSPRWVAASLTGPVEFGGKAIKQCVPCGYYSGDPVKETSNN